MVQKVPVVVFLPVFNEARFIAETLSAIQHQTMTDWICLLGDNASTDGTTEIIAEMTGGDDRFKVFRHPENLGAVQNYWFLLEHLENTYDPDGMMLLGGHDTISERYLQRCVSAIQADADVSMATGRMFAFETSIADAQEMEEAYYPFFRESGMSTFLTSSLVLGNCTVINSVWRYEFLRRSQVLRHREIVRGPDHLFISWMSSLGRVHIDPLCFYFRRFIRRDDSFSKQIGRAFNKQQVDMRAAHRGLILKYLELFDERFPDLTGDERAKAVYMLLNGLARRFAGYL